MKTFLVSFLTLIGCSLFGQPISLMSPEFVASITQIGGGVNYPLKDFYISSGTTYKSDHVNWYAMAWRFQASNTYTLRTNILTCSKTGSPSKNYTMTINADSAGSIGSVLTGGTSNTRNASTCPSSEGNWAFDGFSCSITSGTYYCVVLYYPLGGGYETAGDYVSILLEFESGYPAWKKSDNLVAWTDDITNVRLRYKTYGN